MTRSPRAGLVVPRGEERRLAEPIRESDPRKRRALIERIQAVFYEDVGRIKIGPVKIEGCSAGPRVC